MFTDVSEEHTASFPPSAFFLRLLFDREVGGEMFLRNVGLRSTEVILSIVTAVRTANVRRDIPFLTSAASRSVGNARADRKG
jgi:hypothetical protein